MTDMSTTRCMYLLVLLGIAVRQSRAWVVGVGTITRSLSVPHRHPSHLPRKPWSIRHSEPTDDSESTEKVQSLSLRPMYETMSNPNEFGQELAESVQRWLDFEWMPQEIHVKMGQSCKNSFLECHNQGVDDLMSVMMTMANNLQDEWQTEYEPDAFVNPWDVTNYVSDYLTLKSGVEGCECSSKIH